MLRALEAAEPLYPAVRVDADAGRAWLLAAQNTDGGWGGGAGVASSLEETALALDAQAAGIRPAREIDR